MMGIPDPGRFKERIEILTSVGLGSDWSPSGVIMGELIPETGREFMAADAARISRKVRFRTRYRRAIADADPRCIRLKCRGREYDVVYIEDVLDRHAQLYIVCEAISL